MQIATPESWYKVERLSDDVTLISEQFIEPYYRCNIWHVRGRDRDLLIDSGMGVVSLRKQVALMAERPLLAVASHAHFDHIGNHFEFPERAIHRDEADILANPTQHATVADVYAPKEMFLALPPGGYEQSAYRIAPAPATRLLQRGRRHRSRRPAFRGAAPARPLARLDRPVGSGDRHLLLRRCDL